MIKIISLMPASIHSFKIYSKPFLVALITVFAGIFRASPAISLNAGVFNLIFISPIEEDPLNASWPANLANPYIDSGFCAVSIFCSTVESSI